MDTALLNVDKNNKIIKTNHKNTENQTNHFINTEILMMTLTPQLRKIAVKKRASHPSSVREPDIDFRKLLEKLVQAETTLKFEEKENLKIQ